MDESRKPFWENRESNETFVHVFISYGKCWFTKRYDVIVIFVALNQNVVDSDSMLLRKDFGIGDLTNNGFTRLTLSYVMYELVQK